MRANFMPVIDKPKKLNQREEVYPYWLYVIIISLGGRNPTVTGVIQTDLEMIHSQ